MQYGLKEQTVRDIKSIFALFPEVEEVILYGSRAKGNYKQESDIDLSLKGNDICLNVLNKISMKLDDLLLPYTFDLSIFCKINNPDLIEHIKRAGKVFYVAEKEL